MFLLLSGCLWWLDSEDAVRARGELDAVEQVLRDEHPQAVLDPSGFESIISRGRRLALMEIREGRTKRALSVFTGAFGDPHVSVQPAGDPSEEWPGFVLSLRGDSVVAVGGEHDGERVVSCDGRSFSSWLDETLLLERPGTGTGESVYALVDLALLPPGLRPSVCSFASGIRESLTYTAASGNEFNTAFWRAIRGGAPTQASIRTVSGGEWVHLPSFAVSGKGEDALKDVIAQLPTLRSTGFIVLDVRGNTGGTTRWGDLVMSALWKTMGPPSAKTYAYRATPESLKRNRALASESVEYRDFYGNIANDIETAVEGGNPVVYHESTYTPASPQSPWADMVLLTDSSCVSACSMFVDRVLAMPNVLHLGEPTRGDTQYTWVYPLKTPGGTTVLVPSAAYLGRLREDHEGHTPSIPYVGDRSNTDVEDYVLRQLVDWRASR